MYQSSRTLVELPLNRNSLSAVDSELKYVAEVQDDNPSKTGQHRSSFVSPCYPPQPPFPKCLTPNPLCPRLRRCRFLF